MNVNLRQLLIGCLTLGVSACSDKYQSWSEARTACQKWVRQGDKAYVLFEDTPFGRYIKSRRCEAEDVTRQIIGWEYQHFPTSEAKHTYKSDEFKYGNKKIVKHFRY